ncbi:MAG: hypothetical protein IJD13_00420 [Oscillospiraceae bacterium]|nr:hypothetical protein [Oscillospiraceae bacterium]
MEQKNNAFDKNEFRQFNEQPVRKHSRFLAVVFGFIPGAGHMYLGKMNRGLTLMALCFGTIALGVIFTPVFFLLPLVWFYAFFDCLNLSALPREQLDAQADELGFGSLDLKALKMKIPSGSGGKVLGWAFILVGGYMLYEMLAYRFIDMLQILWIDDEMFWWLDSLINKIPQIVLSVIIIVLGVRLIKGGKKRVDEVPRYQGTGADNAASIMELIRARAEEPVPNEPEEILPEENEIGEEETEEAAAESEKEEA